MISSLYLSAFAQISSLSPISPSSPSYILWYSNQNDDQGGSYTRACQIKEIHPDLRKFNKMVIQLHVESKESFDHGSFGHAFQYWFYLGVPKKNQDKYKVVKSSNFKIPEQPHAKNHRFEIGIDKFANCFDSVTTSDVLHVRLRKEVSFWKNSKILGENLVYIKDLMKSPMRIPLDSTSTNYALIKFE